MNINDDDLPPSLVQCVQYTEIRYQIFNVADEAAKVCYAAFIGPFSCT